MKITPEDIKIKIHIHQDNGIEPKNIASILDTIEGCLYRSDLYDIERAQESCDLNSLIVDACQNRLRKYRSKRIKFYGAESGSIILEGLITASSFYVLKITLGEAIKEGFRQSENYSTLVQVFKEIFSLKRDVIMRYIKEEMAIKKIKGEVRLTDKNEIIIDVDSSNRQDRGRNLNSVSKQLSLYYG